MDDDIKLSDARKQLRALEDGITKALTEFYRSTGIAVTDINVTSLQTLSGASAFHVTIEANL